ncbi:MAG TPA: hypothetical protein VHO25_13975, partial [Polyangiaceae bacterium]|nr:hypothetical protein [Polyangiaceae bacterium]
PSGYSPSQGYWGQTTGMRWLRQSASGVAAARCDYADQFRRSDVPSDVATALRDFVLIPHATGGSVVLVDRAVTGAAERGLHLRLRTPSTLDLVDDLATSTLGESALGISKIWSSSGTPTVREMPRASECPSSDHNCDISRLAAGSEYRVDVAGPAAFALHVIDTQSGVGSISAGVMISGTGYRGVLVEQAPQSVAVITNDAPDAARGSSLTYQVPAGQGIVHVVVDAPIDPGGMSDVTAVREGDNCKVEVAPFSGMSKGFDGSPLIVRLADDCAVVDDGVQLPSDSEAEAGPESEDPGTAQGGAESAGSDDEGSSTDEGGNDSGAGNEDAVGGRPGVGSVDMGSPVTGALGPVADDATGTEHSQLSGASAQGCGVPMARRFSSLSLFAAAALGMLLCCGRRRLAYQS